VREAVLGPLHQQFESDRDEMIQRMRLARDVPAIRARMGENVAVTCGVMGQALAERDGRAADDFEIWIAVFPRALHAVSDPMSGFFAIRPRGRRTRPER
jgi:hypothetical protein